MAAYNLPGVLSDSVLWLEGAPDGRDDCEHDGGHRDDPVELCREECCHFRVLLLWSAKAYAKFRRPMPSESLVHLIAFRVCFFISFTPVCFLVSVSQVRLAENSPRAVCLRERAPVAAAGRETVRVGGPLDCVSRLLLHLVSPWFSFHGHLLKAVSPKTRRKSPENSPDTKLGAERPISDTKMAMVKGEIFLQQ